MAKPKLVWNRWNLRHISKHRVTKQEAEEAYYSQTITRPSYNQRTLLFGETKKGRLIALVLSFQKQQRPYVTSARNMNPKERQYYHDKTKAN